MAQPKTWVVEFDEAAVRDFEDVKGRQDRKAVFRAIDKLKEVGPRLPAPHMKSLKGESDLFELRPKQGRSAVRLVYARIENRFVVLAVAPNKAAFDRTVQEGRKRLQNRRWPSNSRAIIGVLS